MYWIGRDKSFKFSLLPVQIFFSFVMVVYTSSKRWNANVTRLLYFMRVNTSDVIFSYRVFRQVFYHGLWVTVVSYYTLYSKQLLQLSTIDFIKYPHCCSFLRCFPAFNLRTIRLFKWISIYLNY